MAKGSQKLWFWAWLIQFTVAKTKRRDPKAVGEVWKNLVIIQAENPQEALAKARKIGASEGGDCSGTLRFYGRPAMTTFLGIADMGLIHDELEDGAEILWQLRTHRRSKAKQLVKSTKELTATLRKELGGG